MTGGWDDQRLEKAFAARATSVVRPTTAGLAVTTLERLRREPRGRSAVVRLGPFAGLATILVVVVVGATGIGFRDDGPLASGNRTVNP